MTDNQKQNAGDRVQGSLIAPGGRKVTRQQLMNLLANQGYSAGERKGRLKEALTELEQQGGKLSEEDRRLTRAIKKILGDYQAGRPISDDVL